MKHLQTYNESLRDQMKGKSDDDIIKALEGLNDSDKIRKTIKYKLDYSLLPTKLDSNGVPVNLIVNGALKCSNNQLTKLPNNLTVNGYLNCSFNRLTKLPDNLIVNGDLNCFNNKLIELPDNLIVKGDLYCGKNPLPKDIKKPIGVKGRMII